jgi:hypothetical protein
MAGLADDWGENRQTCVDVLCAYVRMPYQPDPGQDAPEPQRLAFQAAREVRHTVIRVITAHLQEDAATSWQGLDLDFTGVVFDGGDFRGAEFSDGRVNFSSARFSSGKVDFSSAQFSGGIVDFSSAQFSGGIVDFSYAEFSSGPVSFSATQFSGGEVDFFNVMFSGGTALFMAARFSGGTVSFSAARFSGGLVDFGGVLGPEADFAVARFSGGTVDFSEVHDWSVPPAFPWTSTAPVGVKLPQNLDQPRA